MANEERAGQARRDAQAVWEKSKKRDEEIVKERDKARLAEASKVARLKELRLIKEAADREAAAKAPPAPRRKPRGS
ncbi:MAG TPA: hypothetical protein VMC10_07175 [Stellaceae bacterium]|nr:hypothetical protein [Stellaceae bacterium]